MLREFGGSRRTGTRIQVREQFDRESAGDRTISRELIPFMRSRNIEFTAKSLKPLTRVYPFFDAQSVAEYCVPKLIEINMIDGTFQVGETIIATPSILDEGARTSTTPYIQFRAATPNHKYGPYNAPTDTYTVNPYLDEQGIPEVYTSTTTILNVDTFSLQLQPQGQYYGFLNGNMTLRGQ